MGPRVVKDAIKAGNGLVCPYYRMDPEKYKHHKGCCPIPGKKAWKVGKVVEHLWRCHAPRFKCPHCDHRCPALTRGAAEKEVRDHIQNCERRVALGGAPRTRRADEPDIMTEAQQNAFEAARQRRNPEIKLDIIYAALDFAGRLPETYHEFPTTVGIQETPSLFPIPEQQRHDDQHEGGTLEPRSEELPTAPTQVLPSPTPTPILSSPQVEQGIDGSDLWPPDIRELLELANVSPPQFDRNFDHDNFGDNYEGYELDDNGRNRSFFGGFALPDCLEAGDMPALLSRESTMSRIAELDVPGVDDVPSLTDPSTLDDKTTVITPVDTTNDAEGKGKGNEELAQRNLDNIYLPAPSYASDDALSLRGSERADLVKGTAVPQEDMQRDWSWPPELDDDKDCLYDFK